MEFRIEKRTLALLSGLVFLAPMGFAMENAPELRYDAWHGHSRPPHVRKAGNMGVLEIASSGVSFEETYRDGKKPKHPHAWRWAWDEIQQLKIEPKKLTVLTYRDNAWKLGADREYEFELRSDRSFQEAYAMLKDRLDQRLVAAIPEPVGSPLWEIPVKHLLRFGGDEGVLQVGEREIVYRSEDRGESRAWRYEDIDNISSSGPFQLSITTFERAKTHYGDRKGFNFQLKQRLEEDRYNDLWLRLNQTKGLKILGAYRTTEKEGNQ
jgi:hypothetical protein